MKPIIRIEAQATPTIDMFGKEKYYWKVYQIAGDATVTLKDGYGKSPGNAIYSSFEALKQYI